MAHKEALSSQHSAISQNQNQEQRQQQKQKQKQKQNLLTPEQQAQALAVKLARTYEELTRLLERNPAMKREITQGTTKEDKVYQKLKQRLKMADMAPRCRWVKQDGTSCRSPQMKQHIYCFAHMQMAEARTLLLLLPPPEDANAIQVGLMKIQKAMIEDTISTKKAGLLLYSMQLALTNVGQTTFGKAKDEEMVRDTVGEEDAISEEARCNQHSAFSEEQNQNQGLLPQRTQRTRRKAGAYRRCTRMSADWRVVLSQWNGVLRRTCTGPTHRKGERLTRPACEGSSQSDLALNEGRRSQ
jgi:hypothetical protein